MPTIKFFISHQYFSTLLFSTHCNVIDLTFGPSPSASQAIVDLSGLRRKVFPEKHVRLRVNLLQHQKSATIKAERILKAQSQQSGRFPASAKKHYSIEESSCAFKKQNTLESP